MAKRKMSMYRTFKIGVFNIVAAGGKEFPAVSIIDGRLVINNECCDLRTIKERYNPETKDLVPSVVDSILCAESMLTMHYGKSIGGGDYADTGSGQKAGSGQDSGRVVKLNQDTTAHDIPDVTAHDIPDATAHGALKTTSEHNVSELPTMYSTYNTLYDFITVDCSGRNDSDDEVKQIKDLLCFDGLYLPLSKLEVVGYIPHGDVEIVEIAGAKYVRYRAAMQSASENRQCKMTMTTYPWADFARTISGDALYLSEPTQTAQKAIARQGLGKSNGSIIEDLRFTFAVVPDLETDITFAARCFNDAKNEITAETVTTKKVATDGCGFITPYKARKLADKLGLGYLPSAFQIRYGQVKGILLVFDFQKYSNNAIKEDILFTESMWKSDFDTGKAQFLVANISKPPRYYGEWNYQMFTTLNNGLSFDDILPYAENIKAYMEQALSSPEAALKFLGILSDISSLDSDEGQDNEYSSVDKLSAVISANPRLAMNIRWVKQSIKRRIDLVSKKMLFGKIPMPQSGCSIMAPDPLAFFNRLRMIRHSATGDKSGSGGNDFGNSSSNDYIKDNSGGDSYNKGISSDDGYEKGGGSYSFTHGQLVVPAYKQAKELSAHEFRYSDYQGKLLATRNPLTHYAQIRKLRCVNHKSSAYWYKHLGQVVIFNAHDETVLGMGGADHDGVRPDRAC